MIYLSANATTLKLAAPVGLASTTITLEAGGGAKWPAIIAGSGFALQVTLMDAATGAITEIVTVTAHAAGSDVLTVLRAQEGTTAKTYLVGDFAALIPTNAVSNNIIQPGRGAPWYHGNDPAVVPWITWGPKLSRLEDIMVCINSIDKTVQIKGILWTDNLIANDLLFTMSTKRFDGTTKMYQPYSPFTISATISGVKFVNGYTNVATAVAGASMPIVVNSATLGTSAWIMVNITVFYE